jgi:hypothetical protein
MDRDRTPSRWGARGSERRHVEQAPPPGALRGGGAVRARGRLNGARPRHRQHGHDPPPGIPESRPVTNV